MSGPLPIDPYLPEATRLLAAAGVLVLHAPPGAGKTTRLPPALLDAGLGGSKGVVVLEPRRIAARMAALRVAAERGGRLGEEVGYRVRFEGATSAATRLTFVTEGVLVRRLESDPELDGVGAVVFDEFHERHLEADLALALVREARATIRPDLRIVVMSATLDPAPLSEYFDGAPVLAAEGRSWPVEVRHAGRRSEAPAPERAAEEAARLFSEGLEGSVLIFMPGASEIRRTIALLTPLAERARIDLLPLHGDLPPEAQEAAVTGRTGRTGSGAPRRRIVVATNLAEASITVEGIEAVIDSGLARVVRYDPRRGLDRLMLERISRSSAAQRAGRAGRTGPGLCVRLYTGDDLASMPESDTPEVRRVDLSEAVLRMLACGARDPASFGWLTSPEPSVLERGIRLLRELGAVEPFAGGAAGAGALVLTPLGREMLRFPVHPRHARVLVEAARRGVRGEAALLVALLSERDPRSASRAQFEGHEQGSRGGGMPPSAADPLALRASSDLFVRADLVASARSVRFDPYACASMGIDARVAARIDRVAAQIRRIGGSEGAPGAGAAGSLNDEALLISVAAGYPDRVVRRRAPGSAEGLMTGGLGVRLDPGSAVRDAPFYVALEAVPTHDARGRFIAVRAASAVRPEWLAALFPALVRSEDELRFDEAAGRVAGRKVWFFADLPLREEETGIRDPERAADLLWEAASQRMDQAIERSRDLEDLLARIGWLRERAPALPLPEDPVREALRPLCTGRKSFAELREAPVAAAVLAALAPEARRMLDRLAPERVPLPSGRAARVEYRPGNAPVVAGRVQEFFGSREGPKIAEVPVLLHLLAPSQRPVQVTSDLASFWRTVYPKIRLELRRRYPKHAWPEDPLSAVPEARPGKRRG